VKTSRLEAFSDGVVAILITILVLEFRVPTGSTLAALRPMVPSFLSYVLSFVYLGIYWNNHHHLLHVTHRVTGGILWANLHLLFWLSLVPFATAWMGQNHFAPTPTALLMAALAWAILQTLILRSEGPDSLLAQAIRADLKGRASIMLYFVALPLAYVATWISHAIYVALALIWLVPDRRIERVDAKHRERR
jgi:uncharacterized membrane protein